MKSTYIEEIKEEEFPSTKPLFEVRKEYTQTLILNQRHPFLAQFLNTSEKVKESARLGELEDIPRHCSTLLDLLDTLFMGYAKAESIPSDTKPLKDFRDTWQDTFHLYMKQLLTDKK